MDSGINIFCFTASYGVALVLELLRFGRVWKYHRAAEILASSAGLVAHTWYLAHRVALEPTAPLASQQEWFLLSAWGVALVYVTSKFYHPGKSLGLFLLPSIEALIGTSLLASADPLVTGDAPRIWGMIHGILLLLGTISVLIGFLAGLMYLLQSHRLKNKLPPSRKLPLPSLEWLEMTNSRSLGVATLMICGGFLTGVVNRIAHQGSLKEFHWTDPVVLSLGAMTVWLLVAELFRMLYPAARRGRKVAYLTMAAMGFLLLVFAAVTMQNHFHLQRSTSPLAVDRPAQPTTAAPPAGDST